MRIYSKHSDRKYLFKIKNGLTGRRIFFVLLVIIGLAGFGLGNIIFGAYLNSTGRTYNLKYALYQISHFNFSFIPNSLKSKFVDIDQIDLDVSFKNWERIRYIRERVFILGDRVPETIQEEVPAKIRFNNKTYKVKIKLIRDLDHIVQPNKWSFMIKVRDGKSIMGMTKFALLYPKARGFLTDWIASKLLQARGIIGLKTGFSNVNINGKNHGLYYVEERFGEKLLENNKLIDGIIFRSLETDLKIYNYNKIKNDPKKLKSIILLKKLWQAFLLDSIKAQQLFDLKKYASLYVISDIMYNPSEAHALFYGNSRMYFNPITNLIEPIPREWGDLRIEFRKPLDKLIIENRIPESYEIQKRISDNFEFKELYFNEAERLTKNSFLDSVIASNEIELEKLTSQIHTENPFYKLPLNILYENQYSIRKKLHPISPLMEVYFDTIEKNKNIRFKIKNRSDFPLEIKRIVYNDSIILLPKERIIILSKYKIKEELQCVSFPFGSMGNSDLIYFSTDSLEIVYSILGINETYNGIQKYIETSKTIVFPKDMKNVDFLNLNPSKKPTNIYNHDFLKVNEEDKIIEFANTQCNIKNDIIIPKGYIVKANPGCTINLTNSSKIVSYSPLEFIGNKENPITITSKDSTGQGIVVFNDKISKLNFVNIKDLSKITDQGWNLDGIVTFYNSLIDINNCTFNDNVGNRIFLNIIKSDFIISNSKFININSDALKIDYSNGLISNLQFTNINRNSIHVNGSTLTINDIEIQNSKYVGVLLEKESVINGENLRIDKANIGVICKDNSAFKISNVRINSSNLALSAYREKSNYKPAIIILNNLKLINNKNDFLIENGSFLTIDGNVYNDKKKKVEKILNGKYKR